MVVADNLLHHVFNRVTPKDVRRKLRKLHRLRLQRCQILSVHAGIGGKSCRQCLRNRSTQRPLQRAAAAVATPETSITLLRTAIIVLCTCASMLCIATIFLVKPYRAQKLMHTARKLEDTLDIVNEELPGLSASARLTGLELADCIVEFSQLGQEVTGGLKAGARAMQATEASLQEGGRALKHTWKNHVVPGINDRVTASKDILNYSLQSNAGLSYSDNTPAHMAATTKVAIQEARGMVAAMGALFQVANKGLGVLTYISHLQEAEGRSEGDVSQSPGPAAEASSNQEWHTPSETRRVDTEPNTWPPKNMQTGGLVSDGGIKESSGSAGISGSPSPGDASSNKGTDGGGPTPPPQREGSQ